MTSFLVEAQKLYSEGKWEAAVYLIDSEMVKFTEKEEVAEGSRIKGWSFYYMAIKGDESSKKNFLEFSRGSFKIVLRESLEKSTRISALNGLPLVLWILGETKEAWEVSSRAVKEFPDEPSAWNTRSILCRWGKDFEQAVEVCNEVYSKALSRGDLRTAGHAKQNRGDALRELGRIEEAKLDYATAIGFYRDFERESGQSMVPHIEGATKKLAAI